MGIYLRLLNTSALSGLERTTDHSLHVLPRAGAAARQAPATRALRVGGQACSTPSHREGFGLQSPEAGRGLHRLPLAVQQADSCGGQGLVPSPSCALGRAKGQCGEAKD